MKKTNAKLHRLLRIGVTVITVLAITIVGFIPSMRSTVSQSEKRELAKFPKFTFSSFFDGSYFSDISLWFSDTVPSRDALTTLNSKFQNFLGTSTALSGFNEGVKGDDIPAPVPAGEVVAESSSTANTVIEDEEVADGDYETIGNVLVHGDAGYEYYNFVQSTANSYVAAVNSATTKTSANVYAMVIPLSVAITLNTNVQKKISSDDQKKATEYILGSMSNDVKKVDIYETLMFHRDEYIYYRTDHHWTALGAYYAYMEFCKAKGITPQPLSSYKKQSFDGFLGTFYNDSGKDAKLKNNSDVVDAYSPNGNYTMTITNSSGKSSPAPLIYDESKADASLKYSCFICGDNPLSVIDNADMTDGETLIVVKESFGNCFVPFLIPHYKKIYVVDYRYYSGTISALANETGATDVLFLNNISMTRNKSLVNKLTDKIG